MHRWIRAAAGGALAGMVASAIFLAIHAVVIVPIWWIGASGMALAMAAGAIISCAVEVVVARDLRWSDGLLLGVLLWGALLPATVVSALLHDIVPEPVEITVGVAVTALYGAAIGARLGHRRWPAIFAAAFAALAFFVRAGGPLTHFESRRALLIFAGLLPVTAVFGITLGFMLLHSRRS
jgi:hypothetical protein